jgi:predicted nucleic acid-binding protein
LIVFDASAVVSAALKADSTPERALLRAEEVETTRHRAVRLANFPAVREETLIDYNNSQLYS